MMLSMKIEKICLALLLSIFSSRLIGSSLAQKPVLASDLLRCAQMGLVPAPKELEILKIVKIGSGIRIRVEDKQATVGAAWLQNELKETFPWMRVTEGTGATSDYEIVFTHKIGAHGDQEYWIDMDVKAITIRIPSVWAAGFAARRVMSLWTSPRGLVDKDGLTAPSVRIHDWPDTLQRGLLVPMVLGLNSPAAVDNVLNAMSRLGYNFVVLELGGFYQWKRHSELVLQPAASRSQVELLVKKAKALGITPIPGLEAIGHMAFGPQVCMLGGPDQKAWVMDTTNKDFYRIYFDLMDEMVEVFDHPSFFHLGTDEASLAIGRLSKLSGRPAQELFTEFVNRTAAHLLKVGIRPVIWHDMLINPDENNALEPANGGPPTWTAQALGQLDKRVIVDYWCYNPAAFDGLKRIVGKGYETWCSPWSDRDGIAQLCRQSAKIGSTAVLGTAWENVQDVGDAAVLTAEHSWNLRLASQDISYEPWDVAHAFFDKKPIIKSITGMQTALAFGFAQSQEWKKQLIKPPLPQGKQLLSGISFDFSKARTFAGVTPQNLASGPEILKAAATPGFRLFLELPGKVWTQVNGVNVPRTSMATVIYTPEFGASTGTNSWGKEWGVENGIIKSYSALGNSPIPPGGFVVSVQSASSSKNAQFCQAMQKGAALKCLSMPPPSGGFETEMVLPKGVSHVALLVEFLNPVPRGQSLGILAANMDGLPPATLQLEAYTIVPAMGCATRGPGSLQGPWTVRRVWPNFDGDKLQEVAMLEFESPGSSTLKSLQLKLTPDGSNAGVTMMAVSIW
jgi:hypothetical protein